MSLPAAIKNKSRKVYWLILPIVLIVVYLFVAHFYIYHEIKVVGLKSVDYMQTYIIKKQATTGKNLVYSALGDSLTSGVGAEKYEESYPYLLAEKLASSYNNIVLKNFSYPGARTANLINDLLDSAIASKPEMVTLLIGTNDVHGNVGHATFKKNYQYILDRLAKETKAKIYLISIPFIGSDTLLLPPYNYYFHQQVIQYNKIIKDLANEYKVNYIDLATPTEALFKTNGAHYAADQFHPSALGYKQWAQIIYDNLNR